MIIRTDCKQTGLYLGWNRRMSGFGGVRKTYMKMNFGLKPNVHTARPGEIVIFLDCADIYHTD
jgi:hypothetical protein